MIAALIFASLLAGISLLLEQPKPAPRREVRFAKMMYPEVCERMAAIPKPLPRKKGK